MLASEAWWIALNRTDHACSVEKPALVSRATEISSLHDRNPDHMFFIWDVWCFGPPGIPAERNVIPFAHV